MASHRLSTALAALLALAPLSALAAQSPDATDPRTASDPRTSTDPRDAADPRDVKDPRDAKDPRDVKDPYDLLEGKALYDALFAAGETGRLKVVMHENSWQLLPYIDSHCEGWLALLEHGAADNEDGKKAMAEMQAKGRKLADLADSSLGDSRFGNYVNNFYGWTPEQQKTFREGQSLFHDADKLASAEGTAQEALRALTPLQQSLDRARALGDTWGQSMALGLMAQIQLANGMAAEARATAKEAMRLGREIRDLESVWAALSVSFESAMSSKEFEAASDALQNQYLLAKEVYDDETADKVMKQLVELNKSLEKAGVHIPVHGGG